MSIDPKEFLPYINGALDGMVQIVEALGDERINLRPHSMPNTNSPFAILTHCVGLTRYFIGTALAGRQVHRDPVWSLRPQAQDEGEPHPFDQRIRKEDNRWHP